MNPFDENSPCPMWRRLAAITYDGLIVLALWMIAAAVVIVPAGSAIVPQALWFQAYLLAVAWSYFAACWIAGGQTLGMRAWRIRLVAADRPVNLRTALLRFVVAWLSALALGAGFITALWHPRRAAWHDRASGTRLVTELSPHARRNSQ